MNHVHVTWTSGLYAGMNALTAMSTKPSADSAAPAKAFSRAIPTPRIPLHT
ncbi:MAG: hypothetical protein JWN96_3657 [Mycobacterium sp.]|jgi:hypothetical protein|nr:hypothetical protein [Mycobacterium sp.]